MGLLYEKKESANREIKKTYQGIIEMMSMIIDSADKAGQSHSYRVSVISGMIARDMGLSELCGKYPHCRSLHDLGKLDVGSEVLDKLVSFRGEYDNMQPVYARLISGADVRKDPIYALNSLSRRERRSGNLSMAGDDIPLGARIIAVADAYDSLLYDSPNRKGLPPPDAKQEIIKLSTAHFDPRVTKAFSSILPSLEVGAPFLTAGIRSRPT
jgi:HD-GYP domain-containing protein (c-di-GMP phosphodiesterase class II)